MNGCAQDAARLFLGLAVVARRPRINAHLVEIGNASPGQCSLKFRIRLDRFLTGEKFFEHDGGLHTLYMPPRAYPFLAEIDDGFIGFQQGHKDLARHIIARLVGK